MVEERSVEDIMADIRKLIADVEDIALDLVYGCKKDELDELYSELESIYFDIDQLLSKIGEWIYSLEHEENEEDEDEEESDSEE